MATIVSNEVNATPQAAPVVTLNATAGDRRVDLSWNAIAGATAQRVFRKQGAGAYQQIATVPPGTTVYADISQNSSGGPTAPLNGTTYTYKVEVDTP